MFLVSGVNAVAKNFYHSYLIDSQKKKNVKKNLISQSIGIYSDEVVIGTYLCVTEDHQKLGIEDGVVYIVLGL